MAANIAEITAKVKKAIAARATETATLAAKYERYKASATGVPIFTRKVASYTKVNNMLNADFVGDVVDTKVGYLVGKPVFVKYTSKAATDDAKKKENDAAAAVIDNFSRLNNLPDIDAETVKIAAVCGWCGRLLYIDEDGLAAVMIIKPQNLIATFDQSGRNVVEACRFWSVTEKRVVDNKEVDVVVTRCEYYDKEVVVYLIQEGADADFVVDPKARADGVTETENLFAPVCPVVVAKNNDDLLGDCDKVLTMVDAYDKAVSDFSSEIESFRIAYLLITGATMEDSELEKVRQTGALKLPNGAKVEWLTKAFNDTALGNLLAKLEKNIIRFAKSVDFTDSNFYGNLTRMAIAFKLWNLETKAMTAELKLGTSFRQMWRGVFAAAARKGTKGLDAMNIEFVFTRNVPINTLEESQENKNLVGVVSDRTRLGRLSFIKNADDEIEAMKKERDEKIADGDYSVTATDGGDGTGDGAAAE